MRGKLKITAYHYNTLCDNYGCNNMAKVAIGFEGFPAGTNYNICNECLTEIVAQAPLDAVLARNDVQAYIEKKCKDAIVELAKGEDVTPAGYDDSATSDEKLAISAELVKSYGWNELRALAKELQIENYTSMKRPELEAAVIAALKDDE